jgi:hypothetical protein
MSNVNDFLPFGTSGSPNVLSQPDWLALATRGSGFLSGIAKSEEFNKAWRQSSVISSQLAQLVSDNLAADVLDDGNTSALLAQMKLAFGRNRVVDTIAALKALPKTGSPRVFVEGYYSVGDGGGGPYWYDSTDTTSADNGGSIIVATDGGRWKLAWVNSINIKQFGAKCDYNIGTGTGTDDSAAVQAAINSIPVNGTGKITSPANSNVRLNSQINIGSRNIEFDCGNSIWTLGANATYMVNLGGTNCAFHNLSVNKKSGVTATAAFFITGLQHVFDNVTARDQIWPILFYCQDMKESHFSGLRVDLDVSGKAGKIFHFDYCVNNTLSDSMLGYCDQALYGSSTGKPGPGYHTEGLLINNTIIVYAGKAVNIDNGTFVAINNCIFDFCEVSGVFVTNGGSLSVANTWIASNLTNGFIGVGTGGSFDGASVQGCSFVRGASPITGTLGVSLPGPNAAVTGNYFGSGMNGGVVTQGGPVHSNMYVGGGTAISAPSSITSVEGALKAGGVDVWVPSGVSGSATAGSNGAPPAQVAGYATVLVGGVAKKVPYYNV